MIYHHGGTVRSFDDLSNRPDRYPFFYFFATQNKDLASDFAHHNTRNRNNIFSFHFPKEKIYHRLRWNRVTYHPDFRATIKALHQAGHRSVLITNCLDRPHQRYEYHSASILVVFDRALLVE